jgi:2-polyprenyl-3-methyl-5-hydroxy-6-metoxy-1,4-benzoquinol methylase
MLRARVDPGEVFRGNRSSEKYQSSNPVARFLVSNFLTTLMDVVGRTGAREAHEIGCGEGQITGLLARQGIRVRGCDVSDDALQVAASEAARANLPIAYERRDIYQLTPDDAAELVLCCEVLEHLTDPEHALQRLLQITRAHLILSVPREPIWHILNMARGKYLTALGNTPGHYNHWSTRQFVRFVARYARIVEVRSPLPWTIVHCRPMLRP